jgi:aspartate/methionine/tyrosine aminotransferase
MFLQSGVYREALFVRAQYRDRLLCSATSQQQQRSIRVCMQQPETSSVLKSAAETLSDRGRALASRAPPRQIEWSFTAKQDAYDPQLKPNGYISLLVAENALSAGPVLAQFQRERSDVLPRNECLQYDYMFGELRFRKALSQLFREHIFAASKGGPASAANPDNYLCAVGASAVLDLVFSALCDDGDAVLIPAPYYPGFDFDLSCRAKCIPVPVQTALHNHHRLTRDALETADRTCRASGQRPRVLLLHSPGNPTGNILSTEELELSIQWCRSHGMHLVSDEAYALSVFQSHAGRFRSVADVLAVQGLGNDVHVVWTFSKDLCMSGMRCGVLFTENQALLQAIRAPCLFSSPSRDTQAVLCRMLSDEQWLHKFFVANQRRLEEAYQAAVQAIQTSLGAEQVRIYPSQAGFFVWVGLQRFLREATWEAELELAERLFREARVLIYPGRVCHAPEPGWYRCCFSAVEDTQTLQVAFERIACVLCPSKSSAPSSRVC